MVRLDELHLFFDQARESGVVNPNVVHNWSGAIGAVTRCLREEEKNVDFLKGHLDSLKGLISSRRPEISRQTLDSYVQRTSNALHQFEAWRRDPSAWQKEAASKPRKPPRKTRETVPTSVPSSEPAPAPAPTVSVTVSAPAPVSVAPKKAFVSSGETPTHRNSVRVPAENGESFTLEFPASFTMADVQRVAWALGVHARDFDPEQMLRGFGKPAKI